MYFPPVWNLASESARTREPFCDVPLAAMLTAPASIFLWEWFTTKPYVDSGEVRFIGHVDSQSILQYPSM